MYCAPLGRCRRRVAVKALYAARVNFPGRDLYFAGLLPGRVIIDDMLICRKDPRDILRYGASVSLLSAVFSFFGANFGAACCSLGVF